MIVITGIHLSVNDPMTAIGPGAEPKRGSTPMRGTVALRCRACARLIARYAP
jgi:hypothetical protein